MKVRNNSGKIFWGLFFILAAVYAVASKLWIMPEISIFSILLTVFFVWILINGIRHINFWEILFPISFICIIYDEQLGITALTPWTVLGAALLGSIGLSLIFKKKGSPSVSFSYDSDGKIEGDNGEECFGEEIRIDNNFGSTIKYVNSDNFSKADVENNFGTLTVYFDNATIQSQRAEINVENNFGETNLYIPKEWKTENQLGHSFGSVKTHGRPEGTSVNVLKLKGEAAFGEINVYFI